MPGRGAPMAAISSATLSSSARRRPVTTSRTPSRPSSLAIARPMPALAPVTSAVRPFSCRSIRAPGLVDDLDVLLVQPLRERVEQRRGHLHPARLRQADVALALRVAVADGDVALATAVLREDRLELLRVGLPVDAQAQQARVRGAHLGEVHHL